jgi:hypothetical protein
MKDRPKIVPACSLLLLLFSVFNPALWGGQTGPEALIAGARTILNAPEPQREAMTKALIDALGASLAILPETDYAEEYKSRIGTVKKMFGDGALFEAKARQYLGLAYKLVSGGKTWEIPAELRATVGVKKGVEKATELCGKLLDSARAEHKAGRNEEACRDLLSFVLLVITPIEA